jgi:UDP-N-acetylglucosamine 4,6-dehydratase
MSEIGSVCPYTEKCMTFIMTGCDGTNHQGCPDKPDAQEPVKPVNQFKDKNILVTGGTGSFGSAFAKHLSIDPPEKLIIFSTGWERQDALRNELGNPTWARWFIGNVRDYDRLYQAFEDVDIVIHAAAIKCIETCEKDPEEALKTNVIGTQNVIRAALNRNVGKVLLISTDKACEPCNTYGASKALAERLITNANNYKGSKDVRFSVVRYGNVIGSNGSVIPKWRKMIADGVNELPVTDANMTRFFYPMQDAVQFVIDALNKMRGGEVYIPRIPSVRIVDLAAALGMPYKIVGIRPGEKIHESLEPGYDSGSNPEFLNVERIKELIKA